MVVTVWGRGGSINSSGQKSGMLLSIQQGTGYSLSPHPQHTHTTKISKYQSALNANNGYSAKPCVEKYESDTGKRKKPNKGTLSSQLALWQPQLSSATLGDRPHTSTYPTPRDSDATDLGNDLNIGILYGSSDNSKVQPRVRNNILEYYFLQTGLSYSSLFSSP